MKNRLENIETRPNNIKTILNKTKPRLNKISPRMIFEEFQRNLRNCKGDLRLTFDEMALLKQMVNWSFKSCITISIKDLTLNGALML